MGKPAILAKFSCLEFFLGLWQLLDDFTWLFSFFCPLIYTFKHFRQSTFFGFSIFTRLLSHLAVKEVKSYPAIPVYVCVENQIIYSGTMPAGMTSVNTLFNLSEDVSSSKLPAMGYTLRHIILYFTNLKQKRWRV